MRKTAIEWCDYTINPVKGLCPMACPYCYARRLYKRFEWNPEIRFEPEVLWNCEPRQPSKIFIGSTMELFGEWIPDEWLKAIFQWVGMLPQHTYIFLTKQPQKLLKWSPFPENCWVGVSATDTRMALEACLKLGDIKATIKYLSIEPMLCPINIPPELLRLCGINWLIIGQQTPPKLSTSPKIAWIQEILVAVHNAGDLPVFIKDNLKPLMEREWPSWKILQEVPA